MTDTAVREALVTLRQRVVNTVDPTLSGLEVKQAVLDLFDAVPTVCGHCGECPPPHHGWCGNRMPHGEHPLPDGRPCCGTTP